MFPRTYFSARYFAPRYFPVGGTVPPAVGAANGGFSVCVVYAPGLALEVAYAPGFANEDSFV